MGLSAFEECSKSSRYCCSSIDRSLTSLLIEASNIPSKCSSRFAHTPEWADGLDIWSPAQILSNKTPQSNRHLDFHRDLGLYLPRHEKPSSAPTLFKNLQMNSKLTTNYFPPERIRQLLKKEKELLLQNDSFHHHHQQQQQQTVDNPSTLPMTVPTNTLRQSNSNENLIKNEVRLPLRHIKSKSSTPPPLGPLSSPAPPPSFPQAQQLNQDALKSLLKEHLTTLLTHGASTTINSNRTLGHHPSFELKQQIRNDNKTNDERISKTDENKTNPTSCLTFQQKATLGLTVIPVDLASQKNFPTISLEKMAQQRNNNQDSDSSSVTSTRPSTQPVPIGGSSANQSQRLFNKRTFETTHPSSGDTITTNDNSNKFNEQSPTIQNNRKAISQPRLSSKSTNQRPTAPTTTIELLPPIISGKRLHIPIANHRYL